MAANGLQSLNDLARLPDLGELQIPREFALDAFGEAGLLGDPPSLILHDEAALRQPEPLHDHWLPPTLSEAHSPSGNADSYKADQERQARPGSKGSVERRAEQNR